MKRFVVSLDFYTANGHEPAFLVEAERNGAVVTTRDVDDRVLRRIEPGIEGDLALQVHRLLAIVSPDTLRLNGLRGRLSIGVFFDTANCNVLLPEAVINALAGTGIAVEVSCYPCEESSDRT